MISVSICDDSKFFLDKLQNEISKDFKKYSIAHTVKAFSSGKEFLEEHKNTPFDVVFLDIKMPDVNGFEVAKIIREISGKTIIIFVTTEDTLVYESFDFMPFDFIPKISPENSECDRDYFFMSRRIDRTIKRLWHRFIELDKIGIDVPYGSKIYIPIEDIQLLRSMGNYVEYFVKGQGSFKARRKLDDAMSELDSDLFARVHKSYGVNMSYIKKIDFSQLLITLKDDSMITISRTHKKEVEAAYIEYLRIFGE